jgi:exopolyphosphatase/guanosine-5'-triphosphate,3'-diphosphate pyrophosphatase
VMEEMLRSFSLKQVVVSAYGLREGVFQSRLPADERAKDPLIEFARDANRRESRTEAHAEELFAWTQSMFSNESAAQGRAREAICLFSDCAWRRHPDDRAIGAFQQVLRGAYVAASHTERVLMAASVFFRYAGDRSLPDDYGMASLLDDDGLALARQIGLAARLAFGVSGSLRGVLPQTSLQVTKDAIVLQLPAARKALAAEPVNKRLAALAAAVDKRPQTVLA